MRAPALWLIALTAALLAATAAAGSAAPTPGACQKDSKLIGSIELSVDDRPTTWWYITRNGLDAAGITDYKANIEASFGTTFATLEDAIEALVDAVRPLDKNGNGYVCAGVPRGTRAVIGEPNWNLYYFTVLDDKHVKP